MVVCVLSHKREAAILSAPTYRQELPGSRIGSYRVLPLKTPEITSVGAIKSAAGILIGILATTSCHSASGQSPDQLMVGSIPKYDSFADSLLSMSEWEGSGMLLTSDDEEITNPSQIGPQVRSYEAYDHRVFSNEPYPRMYFQTQALLFQQAPRFGGQPIVVDSADNTTLLTTSALTPNFTPGVQATLGRRLNNGRAVEFDYMGLYSGTTSAVALKPGPFSFLTLQDNFAGNAFVDFDRAQVDYTSSFNSFAFNLLNFCGDDCCASCDEPGCDGHCCDGRGSGNARRQSLSWFGGFRYINFSDQVNISTRRIVGGGVEEGAYNARTNNNLYGAQLGARLRRTSGRFGWESSGFAGIFGNDASQTQSVTDFPDFAIRPTVTSHDSDVAFVGGGNLSGLYRLNNTWNVKAGYSAIWIDGLALAPNQLDYDLASAEGGSTLHNGGGMLLHGVNVGLEASW